MRSAGGTRDRLLVGACLGALGVLAWLCVLRHGPVLAATRAPATVVAPPVVVVPLPVPSASEPPPALPPPPPAPTPLRVQAEFDRLLASGRIEFETGSNRLRPEGIPLLDAIAGELVAAPELEVEVEGHTDSRGDPSTNRLLSQRRALAVKDYLVGKGIAPGRIHTIGSGATRPIVRASTPDAYQVNRRIEFRVLTPGSR